MMKYPHRKTIRLDDELLTGLGQFCDKYRINESEYIRTSLQKCLDADMRNNQKNHPKKVVRL